MCGASILRVLVSPTMLVGCSPSDWVTWWDSTALKFIMDFFSASWLETSWLLHKYTYTHVHKQIICSYVKLFSRLPLAWWGYCVIFFTITKFSINPMSFVVFSGRKSPSTLLTQFSRALCLQVSPFSAWSAMYSGRKWASSFLDQRWFILPLILMHLLKFRISLWS